jgi:hypothetical protein
MNSKNYIIFNTSEINKIDFSQVSQTSKDTLRVNYNGTKTILKWNGDVIPKSILNLLTKSDIMSNDDIIALLEDPEWKTNISVKYPDPPKINDIDILAKYYADNYNGDFNQIKEELLKNKIL